MGKSHLIDEFFERYAENFNHSLGGNADIESTVNAFANSFVAASPAGIDCGSNDENFRDILLQAYDFYRGAGITSMMITGKQISWLDDLHSMTKINWRAAYSSKTGDVGEIDFDVIYFLQVKQNVCKIFAYITGDEEKALKERGLV